MEDTRQSSTLNRNLSPNPPEASAVLLSEEPGASEDLDLGWRSAGGIEDPAVALVVVIVRLCGV